MQKSSTSDAAKGGDSRKSLFACAKDPFVKICGLTCREDALAAIDAGADALGFNFYAPSVRSVRFPEAIEWIADLPVYRIAVVVNLDFLTRQEIERSGVFSALQFHGDESPEDCRRCSLPWLRAFRGLPDAEALADFPTEWILCDAVTKSGEYGGTGRVADWGGVRALVEHHPEKRIFLAGGLTAENVAQAVGQVLPFAVDVAGGVEESPGRKCARKMRDFVMQAKGG